MGDGKVSYTPEGGGLVPDWLRYAGQAEMKKEGGGRLSASR